ncbi:MAG: ferrochelatase [Bacteroidota bacterium]
MSNTTSNNKRGIVLMNLGSPDSTAVKDVRKYLMQFLMDGRVIDIPYLPRLLLVGGIIVPFRAPKSAEAYREIWTKDGSPLINLTKELRNDLQKLVDEPIEIAMRYGKPEMDTAYQNLLDKIDDLQEVIAIPMYPHYAMSSYETAVEHAKEVHRKKGYKFKLTFIKPYYNDPDYIHALAESIKPYLQNDYDHILFSYHGLPERHITKGDVTGTHCLKVDNCCEVASIAHQHCYRQQGITTMKMVAKTLGIPNEKYSFSFQSRLGREEWLKPYTDFRFQEMPKEGKKKLLVVCPAFVSDCLETLEEIGMRGKETFMQAGGESFTFIPCLNSHPLWVSALAKWIKEFDQNNS